MSESESGKRILAVLQYDGIPERGRLSYLAKKCGLARATARRLLEDRSEMCSAQTRIIGKLEDGLQVDFFWLLNGTLRGFNLRTLRVHFIGLKGYPPEDAALMIRFMTACSTGHRRAEDLFARIESGQLTLASAARLYAHASGRVMT